MSEDVFACPLTRGERILVAIDGSEFSDNVLDQAISMGKICNSEIFVISVVELYPEMIAVAPALEEKLSKDARQTLDKAKRRVDSENIPCETIVRTGGKPHEFIVQEAKEREIDLIVMGTRGKSGLKRIFMGKVTERVIGHAPCPVIVVPV
jgi:nucleotide-binding universal stress UspA family protein